MADTSAQMNFGGPTHNLDLNAIQTAISAETGGSTQEASQEATSSEAVPESEGETTQQASEEATAAAQAPSTEKEKPQTEELRTHRIVVDGQELEVTEADLKAGHMRHRDYTQKTQAIAAERQKIVDERKAWEAERTAISQELTAIDQFLKDQNAIQSYMQRAFGVTGALSTTPPPQIDPNKPMTPQDVAEIAAYNAEQVRLYADRQIAEARAEALKAQQLVVSQAHAGERRKAETEIDAHIRQVLDKFPVLKKFENIEEDLIGEAVRYMPTDRQGTMDEAKTHLSAAAERRMAVIKSVADDEKKQAAIKAADLKRKGTEAPGGSSPKPLAGRKLSLDYKDRKDFLVAAEADLRAMLGQS